MSGWFTALGVGVGAGTSIYGADQAADAVPDPNDLPYAGFDPRADPLLALLTGQASAGLGFAPDENILDAASPLNRLENTLMSSLGKGIVSSKNLQKLNMALQDALGVAAAAQASGQPVNMAELEDSFLLALRGGDTKRMEAISAAVIAAGDGDAAAIANAIALQELGPYVPRRDAANNTQAEARNRAKYDEAVAKSVGELTPLIEGGMNQGLSGKALANSIASDLAGPVEGRGLKLFETALTSGGFDNFADLMTQELSYRERAATQQASLTRQADSRQGARESANMTIDRLLKDYPAYGASDIERESMRALQPYQAQELEQANTLGYNPATNLAMTRGAGIRDALAILSGRQGLTNTALGSLSTILGGQTGQALAVSGQSQAAFANAANIASQQALALQKLTQQGEIYEGAAKGSGTFGAGALISDYLSGLGAQPGTQQNYSYYGNGRGGGGDSGPA